ncbi:SDR family NAD(P)-dependent oxidoreductase [Saccharopolyspora sp. 5N102]|uniref:SDR family NAD(P)-dependent oxidoreductase n=1 Tax=Saccharopolyspora sp. 5N102 TaxID=3375155 RepID=UPI0037B33ACB
MSVALVTGAAGGIGAAVAERLAQEHTVLLTDVDPVRLAAVSAKLFADGAAVAHAVCDVSERSSVQAAFDAAEEQLGEVTAVANVAGIGGVLTEFTELSEKDWDRTFAVNTRGTFLVCQEFVRRRAGRPGAIVAVGSIGARLGMDTIADYGASKAAVIELVHAVARFGAPSGLRANTVLPGLIWTDMWRKATERIVTTDPAAGGATPEEVFAGYVDRMVPMKRPQTPADIAESVGFLLSERARNVTGQTIAVDGGTVMT